MDWAKEAEPAGGEQGEATPQRHGRAVLRIDFGGCGVLPLERTKIAMQRSLGLVLIGWLLASALGARLTAGQAAAGLAPRAPDLGPAPAAGQPATRPLPVGHSALEFDTALLGTLATSGPTAQVSYFRSEHGIAPQAGPLPERLEAPGALRWRVELDPGHSSPLLGAGKLFLTTYHPASRELATVAMDPQSGQVLWRAPLDPQSVEQTHPIGSPATATPACDGRRVFSFFGSYGLLCYDLSGAKLWEHRLGPFRDEYGAGSSPILVDGKVILNEDHDLGSFLIAIEAATGKTLWQTARPEAVRSYATPALWTRNGRPEILVAGALELTAYNPANGARVWWVPGLARIVIPSPVPAGALVYMASWAPGGDTTRRLELDPWTNALAKWDKNKDGKLARAEIDDREVLDRFYRMDLNQDGFLDQQEWERHAAVFHRAQNAVLALRPGNERGELGPEAVVWKHQRGIPYVATPLVDQGRLWMVKEGGIVTKLDLADGHLLQEERIPGFGNYFASPVTGDGKVFFASEPGTVSIVANQTEWRVLSSHDFHERIYATPAIVGDRLYVRTEAALYCFQGQQP